MTDTCTPGRLAAPLAVAALLLLLPHPVGPAAGPTGVAGFSADAAHTGTVDGRVGTRLRTLWIADVGVQGYYNSPVVAGTLLLVSSYGTHWNSPDERDGVYVIRRTDGTIVRHHPTPADANGVSTDGARVFVAVDDGSVHAWDLTTGGALWSVSPFEATASGPAERLTPQAAYQAGYDAGFAAGYAQAMAELGYVEGGSAGEPRLYGAPLVLPQGLLVAGAQGLVKLLDPATGQTLRGFEGQGKVRNHSAGDGLVAFGNARGQVEVHGIGGELRYRFCPDDDGCTEEYGYSGRWIYAAPAIGGGRIAACAGYYSQHQFTLLDAASGRLLWSFGSQDEAGMYYGGCKASPALTDKLVLFADTVYGSDGRLMAHALATGQRRWMIEGYGGSWGSPVVVGKTVVWVTQPGTVVIANADNGKVLATLDLGDTIYATPAVSDGVIYVGGDSGKLYAVDTGMKR